MSNSEPHPAAGDWGEPLRVDGLPGPAALATDLVVGFDRKNASHIALGYAIGLAGALSAHLDVVHVIDTDDLPIDPDAADWNRAINEVVEREHASACSMLDTLPGNWSCHEHQSNPAHGFSSIADANDASMIVLS